jgi:3-deoxy-D-manno-octulosonate 8-phosphate phosphatase (KDO 8-P phosphatase)
MEVTERARKIRLLLMDCDGVLTDGRLYFGPSGEELKVFHVRDGQGIVSWHAGGFRSGIISGRNSPIVELRGSQLGIEFIRQGIKDKAATVQQILESTGVTADEAAFIGDDTPDIAAFKIVGLPVAVADAIDEVKSAADLVTHSKGGRGAVREVIDLLIASKFAG